jgi:hypothetical protein
MDSRVIRGLTVLAGIMVYWAAGYLPADQAEYVRQLAMMFVGGQTFRRAGDLGPVDGRGDS